MRYSLIPDATILSTRAMPRVNGVGARINGVGDFWSDLFGAAERVGTAYVSDGGTPATGTTPATGSTGGTPAATGGQAAKSNTWMWVAVAGLGLVLVLMMARKK